jgi:hypothetical protein
MSFTIGVKPIISAHRNIVLLLKDQVDDWMDESSLNGSFG